MGLEVLCNREGIEAVEMLEPWPVKATAAAIPGIFQILERLDVSGSS
jgi:hypothetical protein